jgi:hypothetical protein
MNRESENMRGEGVDGWRRGSETVSPLQLKGPSKQVRIRKEFIANIWEGSD